MSASDLLPARALAPEVSRGGGSVDAFAATGPTRASDVQGRLIAGRYRVTGVAGQGGHAEVLIAIDVRLDRDVAVKRL